MVSVDECEPQMDVKSSVAVVPEGASGLLFSVASRTRYTSMRKTMLIMIRFYQKVSRVLVAPTCRFYPSCSDYSLAAIEKYGAGKGFLKSLSRILRCSPLSRGGYDPLN